MTPWTRGRKSLQRLATLVGGNLVEADGGRIAGESEVGKGTAIPPLERGRT